jgi:hypothetical protein
MTKSWSEGQSDFEIKLCEQVLAYMTDHVLEWRATNAGIAGNNLWGLEPSRNRVDVTTLQATQPVRIGSLE